MTSHRRIKQPKNPQANTPGTTVKTDTEQNVNGTKKLAEDEFPSTTLLNWFHNGLTVTARILDRSIFLELHISLSHSLFDTLSDGNLDIL